MQDDFAKYESLKAAGNTPEQVYAVARQDGVDPIMRIRMIRAVYSLTLAQAKEVHVRAENSGKSLDRLTDLVESALQKDSAGSK